MPPPLERPWPAQQAVVPRLAPPPRHVPITVAVRALLGGLGVFAWIWFGFGSSIATVFLGKADLGSWATFRGELVTAEGVATGCAATGSSEGGSKGRSGTPIYENRYRFGDHEGVSYATGTCLAAGTPVEVQHLPARPDVSRIAGMRRAEFGPGIAFVLVFPIVGLLLVGFSLRTGVRQLRLLRNGKVALGTLVGKEATNTSVNKRRVMKLRFAIETDRGERREVVVRTHLPEQLEDEPRERILCDPRRPDRAAAWDLLSGAPRVDGTGALEPTGLLGTLLVLLPPALAVAAHALALGLVGR